MAKFKEKEKAIKLRKKGLSYSEILEEIPVAKSTLSLWLRSIGLAKRQRQRLTEKKLVAMRRGWEARRRKRFLITEEIKTKARNEICKISKRELWLMGTMLYWAEGTKEKPWNTGVSLKFSNSDPTMISIFLKWLKEIFSVTSQDITCELYIHETADWQNARLYWSNILAISTEKIRIYFKKHKINHKRHNTGKDYYGLIAITAKKSSSLNRKVTGWIEGICKYCGVV